MNIGIDFGSTYSTWSIYVVRSVAGVTDTRDYINACINSREMRGYRKARGAFFRAKRAYQHADVAYCSAKNHFDRLLGDSEITQEQFDPFRMIFCELFCEMEWRAFDAARKAYLKAKSDFTRECELLARRRGVYTYLLNDNEMCYDLVYLCSNVAAPVWYRYNGKYDFDTICMSSMYRKVVGQNRDFNRTKVICSLSAANVRLCGFETEEETEKLGTCECTAADLWMQCLSRKPIIRKMGPGISHGPSVIPPFGRDGLDPAAMMDTSRRPLEKAA